MNFTSQYETDWISWEIYQFAQITSALEWSTWCSSLNLKKGRNEVPVYMSLYLDSWKLKQPKFSFLFMFKFQYPQFYGKSSSKAVKSKTHTLNFQNRCEESKRSTCVTFSRSNFFIYLWCSGRACLRTERTVFKGVSQQTCISSP